MVPVWFAWSPQARAHPRAASTPNGRSGPRDADGAPGEAVTLTAVQLEQGGGDLTGALGDGAGKWRLTVASDRPLVVMSLMESLQPGSAGGGGLAPRRGKPRRPPRQPLRHDEAASAAKLICFGGLAPHGTARAARVKLTACETAHLSAGEQ